MTGLARWVLIAGIVVVVAVVPFVHYRYVYTHGKRLREVVPGRVYRSGQLTAPGFAQAIADHGIRTVINLQDEYPDPDISEGYFSTATIKEIALCRRLGVRYVHVAPDLVAPLKVPEQRPKAIDQFLALMDDPDTYPVLIHCRAGLHRTGVMVAVYRMEYQGWGRAAALREVKANGFGETVCNVANGYIAQYVVSYRPGLRRTESAGREVHVPKSWSPVADAPGSPLHAPRP